MKTIVPPLLLAAAIFGFALEALGQTPTLYSLSVSNDHPLVYWSFDDGTGTQQMPLSTPSAMTANDLVPENGAGRVSHASLGDGLRLGNAAEFNGTNFFEASAMQAGPALTNAYAIEFWVQSTATNSAAYLINIGPLDTGNSPAIIYNFSPNVNYLELFAGAGGRTATSGPIIADNQWHHVLIVYYGDRLGDGVADEVDAYLDGTLYSNIGNELVSPLDLKSLIVGAAKSNGVNPFQGRIDELAIYDLSGLDFASAQAKVSAMDSSHIASAEAASGPSYSSVVLADNPLLYWNFDETNGDARQLAPITLPTPDNTRNELTPSGSATFVSHAALGSGLQLGDAVSLDGNGDVQIVGGLDTGLAGLNGPWAVEMWFQLTASQEVDKYLLNMGANRNHPGIIYGFNGFTLEVFGNGRSGTNGIPITDENWHHLLVVNYDTAPGSQTPGANVNRVDFFIDGTQYKNVGGGFNTGVDFGDWLIFGAATADNSSGQGLVGNMDELAIYDLSADTNVAQLESRMIAMDSRHYAAAFGSTNVEVITITQQPASVSAQLGQTASFSVAATASGGGGQPLTYQWLRNGSAITGATDARYTTPALALRDAGTNTYQVRVSAGPAFKYSDLADLLVPVPPPAPATAYQQAVQQSNPLLYWNFDEMVGPAVEQIPVSSLPVTTENDLVPQGGISRMSHTSLADGLDALGNAAEFDGASYFLADGMRLGKAQLNGPWAVEFWVQTYGASQAYLANFGAPPGDNSPALILGFTTNDLELFGGSSGRTGDQGPAISDTDWHHVLWVNYDTAPAGTNNRVDVYFDGVLHTNVGNGFSKGVSLDQLMVGAALTSGVNGFPGGLDEFALYDLSGMSASDIAAKVQQMATNHYALAHATGGPSYTDTVLGDHPLLYYNFNEADGNALQLAPVTLPAIVPSRNNLLATGGATRVEHSAINDGLYLGNTADLDGTSYYQTPQLDPGRPPLRPPWAVELWMQSLGPNQHGGEQAGGAAYLLNFGNNSPALIYNSSVAPGELDLYVNDGNSTTSGAVVNDNNWHYLLWVDYGDATVGVADRVDLYLDGVCYSNVQNTFSSSLNIDQSLLVGASMPGYNGFQGRIDEVAVYDLSTLTNESDVTLAAQQLVTDHRAAASVPPPPSLSINLSSGQLVLSWQATGFKLQQNDSLTNASGWSDVSGGGSSPVTIAAPTSGPKFYRLIGQ